MASKPRALATSVRAQAACFSASRLLCALHRKDTDEYWVLPGGHVEPGETLWDAVVRELAEETGLLLESAHLWAVSEYRSPSRHVLDCTFFVTRWTGRPVLGSDPDAAAHPASLSDVGWLDREAFTDAHFRPTVLGRHLRAHWADPATPAAYLGVESV